MNTFRWHRPVAAASAVLALAVGPMALAEPAAAATHNGQLIQATASGHKDDRHPISRTVAQRIASLGTLEIWSEAVPRAAVGRSSVAPNKFWATGGPFDGRFVSGVKSTYQWYVGGKPIRGATKSSFTPTLAHQKKLVVLRMTATAPFYKPVTGNYEYSDPAIVKMRTVAPTIKGAARVGSVLTADIHASQWPQGVGEWPGVGADFQWLADGKAIKKANSARFKVTSAQAGERISVRVVAWINGYKDAGVVTSAKTAMVPRILASPTPAITGTVKVGRRLTAKADKWTTGSRLSYQWYANGKPVPKATKPTLKLAAAQRGKKITVKVTGTKAGYAAAAKVSKATRATAR